MKLKYLVVFSFIILLLSLGTAAADDNNTSTFDDLQMKINNATTGDVIEVDGTYKYAKNPLNVDKSLTFQGKNNGTLDMDQKDLYIEQKKSTFKDLTFSNYNEINTYKNTFINCTFISKNPNSEVSSLGRGNFINCTFISSPLSAATKDSVIGSTFKDSKEKWALSVAGSDLHISDCTFERNIQAIDIYNANNLLIENCLFTQNSFKQYIAVYKRVYGMINWISGDVYYTKNVRVNQGTLRNCTFVSNNAKDGSIIFCDCNPYDDDGYDKPINSMDIVNMEYCTFIDNQATEAVINLMGNSKSSISHCIFDDNNAKYICEANSKLDNNFWGYNIENSLEFETMNYAFFKEFDYYTALVTPKKWANINLVRINSTHAKLQFKTNKGEDISMPEYSISVNGEKIKVGDNFAYSGGDLTILNNKNKPINRANYILKVTKSSTNYYHSTTFAVKVTDLQSKALKNMNVLVKYSNGNTKKLKTDSNGAATFLMLDDIGTYSLTISACSEDYVLLFKEFKDVKIIQAPAKVSVKKLKTTYNSGEKLKIKLINTKLKKVIPYAKFKIKVYTGKKSKTYALKTNEKGIAEFDTSKLKLGTHKVEVISGNKNMKFSTKKTTVQIKKAKLSLKYSKNVAKSSTFKIVVKNKKTKKLISNVKFKVKAFTGKKSKTYNLKTNKKGILKVKTGNLKKGSHKVVVDCLNTNYVLNSKFKIRIQ